ncbi:MAG: hypothetical protein JXA90_15860, partial [Planctomycetes bacterium]|nr:hypothetical protein [Planctomycetota bacterium]
DLARARGPTAGAVSIDGGESSRGIDPASPVATPSTYARRGEAISARHAVLADVLEDLLGRLKAERRFRDLKILELLFSRGVSQQDAARLAETSEPTVSRTRKAMVEDLRRLVARHRQADALDDIPWGDDVSRLVSEIWAENLFTCLKRSTLGSHALGVLEGDWEDYVRFHLETIACEYCAAHLADISTPEKGVSEATRQRIFTSSAGFLK